ncbi:MAG TPA: carboxypeptidase regulatory-like domain-containing protein [Nitrospiraceae bacterium]|nr:carboxypeptidase regulatory-like domain-containing protein [Nitrospiraceae bacterium]
MRYLFAFLFALLTGISSPAWSYEEATVTDGGRLLGTITLDGHVPKPKGYNLITLPDQVYCGRISDGQGWRLLQPFNVGTAGEFRDVVVYLEGVEKGKSFSHVAVPRIEARDCRFIPFTTVVREKEDVVVVNMDPVMHDIQAYETSALGPRVLFNVPLPMNPQHPRDLKDRSDAALYHKHLAGEPMKQLVGMSKGRRVFVMQCGFHAYMESWGLVIENPYFALTDQDGRFEISDIPPGTYKMVVWHPYVGGSKEQIVTIPPKDQARVDVKIPAPTGRLYANQMVENPYTRYGITEDAQSQIVPTLIHQKP